MASIEARKPDFDSYIAPQKEFADIAIEVVPTELDPEDKKTLRVRHIQKVGVDNFAPAYLFDEGSSIEWTPCGKNLECSYLESNLLPDRIHISAVMCKWLKWTETSITSKNLFTLKAIRATPILNTMVNLHK